MSAADELAQLREQHAAAMSRSISARGNRDARGAYQAHQEALALGVRIRDLEFPSTVPASRR